jgi:hypothetical protein
VPESILEGSSRHLASNPKRGTGVVRRLLLVLLASAPFIAAFAIGMPLCPMAALLGVPCPGCGLSRATLALVHGEVAAAFRFHPAVFWVTPVYLFLVGGLLFGFVRGTPPVPSGHANTPRSDFARWLLFGRLTSALAAITIALLVGVWVARFCGFFGGPVPVETFRNWRLGSPMRSGFQRPFS